MKVIREHLKTGIFKPVYLLYGTEVYLKKLYQQKLKEGILNGSDDINYAYFEGKSIPINEIIQIAETMPFFFERRLIVIENSGLFKNANDFADYLKGMPSSTHIVFCESEVDKRNRLYKAVSELGVVSEMEEMDEANLRTFVGTLLKKDNKKITDASAGYLIEIVGPDMTNLQNETEKLICYAFDREVIIKEDIDAVCVEQISGKIFQLTEAIGEKKQALAFTHYNTMLAMKERPLSILFHIVRHFNLMLQVQEQYAKGLGSNAIASKLNLKPFVVNKYIAQAKNFKPAVLRNAIEYGTDLEAQVKSGLLHEKIAVEFLVVKFTSM